MKNICFLNIIDLVKRDTMVKEFLNTKEKINAENLASLPGEKSTQRELTKIFKPVVESEK